MPAPSGPRSRACRRSSSPGRARQWPSRLAWSRSSIFVMPAVSGTGTVMPPRYPRTGCGSPPPPARPSPGDLSPGRPCSGTRPASFAAQDLLGQGHHVPHLQSSLTPGILRLPQLGNAVERDRPGRTAPPRSRHRPSWIGIRGQSRGVPGFVPSLAPEWQPLSAKRPPAPATTPHSTSLHAASYSPELQMAVPSTPPMVETGGGRRREGNVAILRWT